MTARRAVWRPHGPALLFCPADRPDRYLKAAAVADVVVLDLEDGVAGWDKAAARRALQQVVCDPHATVVRVNAVGTDDYAADVDALAGTPYDTVMLAKTESADDVAAVTGRQVVALIETPRGVLAAGQIAGRAAAVMWGAEDLIGALGGTSSRHAGGRFRDVVTHARSAVLLAAAAQGIAAVDTVFVDIDDPDGLRSQAEDAAGSGFAALACIHPSQVPVVQAAYRPSESEMAVALRVLKAAETAAGVFALDGRMIDEPLLRQARRVVERFGCAEPAG